jgi:hypothetical protein
MNYKLALIALLVIIGCAIAHAQVNKGGEFEPKELHTRSVDDAAETEAAATPCTPVNANSGSNSGSTSAKASSTSTTGTKSATTSGKSATTTAGKSATTTTSHSATTSGKSATTSGKSATTTTSHSATTSGKSATTTAGKSATTTTSHSATTSGKSATTTAGKSATTTTSHSATTSGKSATTSGKSSTTTTGKSSTTKASTTKASTTGSSSSTGLCDIVPATEEPLKLLVPLYVDPGSAWTAVASAAASVDIIAIINPNSGPTSSLDSSYSTYMNTLNNAGVEMIGYVYTSYGDRSLSDVEKDIDTYASVFPHLVGIFFDEASADASDVSYYTSLYNYVLSKGFVHSILNPGTQPADGYVDISTNIVIFEDTGSKFSGTSFDSWVTCAPSSSEKSGYKYKFSAIGYGITSSSSVATLLSSMQSKGVGLVYVTDGADTCCVYNELATYFASEASSVASLNA